MNACRAMASASGRGPTAGRTTQTLDREQLLRLILGEPDDHADRNRAADGTRPSNRGMALGALIYLDIDAFRIVNETAGYDFGDFVLSQVVDLLASLIRPGDAIARVAGNSFVLWLADCPLPAAEKMAEGLLRTLAATEFGQESQLFRLTASAGASAFNSQDLPAEAALRAADDACYLAKQQGRNRVVAVQTNDPPLTALRSDMAWTRRLRSALNRGGLRLAAQPIRRLGNHPLADRAVAASSLTGPSVGDPSLADSSLADPSLADPSLADPSLADHDSYWFEMLVRMDDGAGGLLMPGTFLPAAERYGLIAELDRWVVDASIAWAARWLAQRGSDYMIAINLSGLSLNDGYLAQHVGAALRRHGIAAKHLCFEITETAAIQNLSAAVEFMDTLRSMGCRFALDDFGTGVSSFGYLKNLPVDFVKIDGLFVKNLATDSVDQALVESINQLCHRLGMETIAEYVEDEATARRLRQIGVDYVQGYAVGWPRLVM